MLNEPNLWDLFNVSVGQFIRRKRSTCYVNKKRGSLKTRCYSFPFEVRDPVYSRFNGDNRAHSEFHHGRQKAKITVLCAFRKRYSLLSHIVLRNVRNTKSKLSCVDHRYILLGTSHGLLPHLNARRMFRHRFGYSGSNLRNSSCLRRTDPKCLSGSSPSKR